MASDSIIPSFIELSCTSNCSFLSGASHPDELVAAAAALGYGTLGLTDRNSLAGMVRAHVAAKQTGVRLVVGTRLVTADGLELLLWPSDRAAYGRLSELLTTGKRRAPKGQCRLDRAEVMAAADGLWAALVTEDPAPLGELREAFGPRLSLLAQPADAGQDAARLWRLAEAARQAGVPLLASNGVLMHSPERRPLLDVLTCIRDGCTVDEAGYRLTRNAERHLKPSAAMAALFRDYPQALHRSLEIAEACRFSLDELAYEYPIDDADPQGLLERLTWEGAAGRYPAGIPARVRAQIQQEFALIGPLGYAPYFLTVHDIVRFARSRGILCQGRGSAANSAVCFCLGITAVDPARSDMLFERFISAARDEPPDIDVDFEHERREEVVQYIYVKYGRDRAGLAAAVISYRSRSAIREVGKALGLSQDTVAALSGTVWGSSGQPIPDEHVRELGLDPQAPRLRLALDLAQQLKGFPRHLSQHVGGFVLTRGPLSQVVPIANAAMAGRTVVEWDKDDLDALGILKIDVLALGMLTCLRKALDLLSVHDGIDMGLADVPAEDAVVYDMLCRGDSIGVFQVESRAQMSMLPRLKPRCFYDLVIQVAIVRPGPIQGNMVHPYLRRRNGQEPVSYPSPTLRRVLEKTLGVPLFQEQAMRIAMDGAGFSATEADQLRRAMAAFRRKGAVAGFRDKFLAGMTANGYDSAFAAQCFRQIEGFGDYGFPESHAASFALLVYVSAWLKCHHPAAFACALLNSQPMGFYAPAQIVRDARAHGVAVLPVDVNRSQWDCTLENGAMRLGFRQIKGFAEADADRLVAARGNGYADVRALWRRADLAPAALAVLAAADAFAGLGLNRRQALWAVKGLGERPLPLFRHLEDNGEPEVRLPEPAAGEQIVDDYAALRLTLRQHPMALLRPHLNGESVVPTSRLATARNGSTLSVAGLVTVRQRPGSARGIIFLTMEDETGIANIIIRPPVFEAHRRAVLSAALLCVTGRLQREGLVIHVIAARCLDWSAHLRRLLPQDAIGQNLRTGSRDFH